MDRAQSRLFAEFFPRLIENRARGRRDDRWRRESHLETNNWKKLEGEKKKESSTPRSFHPLLII